MLNTRYRRGKIEVDEMREGLWTSWYSRDGYITTHFLNRDQLEAFHSWKRVSYRRRQFIGPPTRGEQMQRTFTIEIKVDYADADKNEAMGQICAAAGRHVLANASLLADNGVKPQCVVFSDDYFKGAEAIELLPDTLAQGNIDLADDTSTSEVSEELMAALRDTAKTEQEAQDDGV